MWVDLETLIVLAGVGQLTLTLGSLAIPRVLGWKAEMARLRALTRQVFWTYAAYIWFTNLSFGLISTFAPQWLTDRSPLASAVTAFISIYWGARVVIQFVYFDRTELKSGVSVRMAETALVVLFLCLTVVYGYATIVGLLAPSS